MDTDRHGHMDKIHGHGHMSVGSVGACLLIQMSIIVPLFFYR